MSAPKNTPEQFHGVWNLHGWQIEYEDGGITYPLGEIPTGQLIYLPDGMVSVAMVRSGHGSVNQGSGKGDKLVNAMGYSNDFQYDAQWSLVDDTVIHDVKWSLNPNMTGTKQIRKVGFEGQNKLTLSTFEPMKNGQQRKHVLKWTRAK